MISPASDPHAKRRQATPTTISELVATVAEEMHSGHFSAESAARLGDLVRRFASFAERGCGIVIASAIGADVAGAFVDARASDGSLPALATRHLRRSAVRLLFVEGRRLGLVAHDPTMDLRLPPRSSLRARPLTDEEVAICRSYSIRTLTETRQPTAWALAEATARSAELSRITVGDLDLDRSRVWIPGSSKTEPRFGEISEWARAQLEHRLKALGHANLETPLVCAGAHPGVSATSSASTGIADTLRRAGLHHERDIRPASVAAWAGATALAAGEPIERIALMLGIRSLDRAAAFIGFSWR